MKTLWGGGGGGGGGGGVPVSVSLHPVTALPSTRVVYYLFQCYCILLQRSPPHGWCTDCFSVTASCYIVPLHTGGVLTVSVLLHPVTAFPSTRVVYYLFQCYCILLKRSPPHGWCTDCFSVTASCYSVPLHTGGVLTVSVLLHPVTAFPSTRVVY